MTSLFAHVDQAPPDPIFGLTQKFKDDTHEMKLNLGVGAYRTEEQEPYVLNVVKKTEAILLERNLDKEYLPIEGYAEFVRAASVLVLGSESPAIKEDRVAAVQSLGGTGALRIGFEFLNIFSPDTTVYIPSPTWGNHRQILTYARLPFKDYRYYNPATKRLDIEGFLEDIRNAPRGSVFIIHACAHNPTGIDPSIDQWLSIEAAMKEAGQIPFFDFAYQGFASGSMEHDAFSIRMFVERGWECFVAQSYSKNLGFYSERLGTLQVVTRSTDAANRVKSQLKKIIRAIYSNPPSHGARVAAHIMTTPVLFAEWEEELRVMSRRLSSMRQQLYQCLIDNRTPGDWSHIQTQIGMFTYLGLSPAQVQILTEQHHLYLTSDARVSVAGLSERTVPYLADAIKHVVELESKNAKL